MPSVPSAASTASDVLAGDDDRLADIERPGGAQVIEAKRDIGTVALRRLHAAERAFRHQDFRRHFMRAEQPKAVLLENPAPCPISR